MTKVADEIRRATSNNELHPLVANNLASPRGTCNSAEKLKDGSVDFCTLDYGHDECPHMNGQHQWIAQWPPPEYITKVETPTIACCVSCNCEAQPAHLWFTIHLITDEQELHFCPAHALAAEALVGLGLGGGAVRAILQKLDFERRKAPKRELGASEARPTGDPDDHAVLVANIENTFNSCQHEYSEACQRGLALAEWCNVCGARNIGGVWFKPHWRDLIVKAFKE